MLDFCRIRTDRQSRMVNKGMAHMDDVLDVLNLMQTKKRLEVLENFVFRDPLQKKVSRMNVEHYLGTDT